MCECNDICENRFKKSLNVEDEIDIDCNESDYDTESIIEEL